MSSRHTVKDKQEFALLIADGEACSPELVTELLEWNPYIAVLDGAMPRVYKAGIKADAWIGDFDEFDKPDEFASPLQPL